MQPWQQPYVWQAVAEELRELRHQGLSRLLTEETVRFATVKALVQTGTQAADLRYEWPHPALPGSRIDLIAGQPPRALFEFKYPREPNKNNAAWTMTYGEVLKDFYRLAAYPYAADRIFVYAESAHLTKYMAGAASRYGLDVHADDITLHPDLASAVPTTVATIFGPTLTSKTVTAHQLATLNVDATLLLRIYAVDATVDDTTTHAPPEPPVTAEPTSASASVFRPRVTGARAEILLAIDAVLTRSGASTFELNDVLAEMRRRNSTYAESTVRTMVTSHMCANAPDHSATKFDDLERVDRGLYRRR